MKVMTEYFISQVRVNKRKSILLFCSILLASVVISIFACMYTAQHSSYVDFAIDYMGSQHFTINEQLTGEQIGVLRENVAVAELHANADYVHITVHDVKNVYPISESLAESIGLERNGYGVYNITYNRQLLGLYGIKDPYTNSITALGQLLLTAAAFIVMVMILFVLIIGGTYAAFGRLRQSELGLLKSVGATPEQIRYLLYLEIIVYSIPAIILGLLVGYIVQSIVIKFAFSLWVTLACAVLVLLTVLVASASQIRRLTYIPIIAAISGSMNDFTGGNKKKKSKKVAPPISPVHPARSLAWQFYKGNRSSYRMSMIALTLFFAIGISFQTAIAFVKANSAVQLDEEQYNINISFGKSLPNNEQLAEIAQIGDAYTAYYSNTCTITTDENIDLSANTSAWIYNGQTVLHTILYGFDDITYQKICEQSNAEQTGGAILVNNVSGTNEAYFGQASGAVPLADSSSLTLCARSPYDMENSTEITIPITATTALYPEVDGTYFPYDVVVMLNQEEYLKVDETLYGDESMSMAAVKLYVPYDDIEASVEQIATILDSSEYKITTRIDREQAAKDSLRSTEQFFNILITFFGLLGLLNAVNHINTSLESRKRELAILRSIGMDKKEEGYVFLWEAAVYSALPLVLSFPVVGVVALLFKAIFERVSFVGLFGQLSWIWIIASILPIVVVIFVIYLWNWRKKSESIVTAVAE